MLTGTTKWQPLEKALFNCILALEGKKDDRIHLDTVIEYRKAVDALKSKL